MVPEVVRNLVPDVLRNPRPEGCPEGCREEVSGTWFPDLDPDVIRDDVRTSGLGWDGGRVGDTYHPWNQGW